MADTTARPRRPRRPRRTRPPPRRVRRRQGLEAGLTGWGFVAPATIIILGPVDLPGGLGVRPLVPELGRLQRRPTWVGGAELRGRWSPTPTSGTRSCNTVGLHACCSCRRRCSLGLFLAVALNRRIRFIGLLPHGDLRAVRRLGGGDRHPLHLPVQPAVRPGQQRAAGAAPAAAGLAGGPAPGDGRDRDHVAVGVGGVHDGDLPRRAAGRPGRPARGGPDRRREPLAGVLARRLAAARAGHRVRRRSGRPSRRSSCSTSSTRRRAAARSTRRRRSSTSSTTRRSTPCSSATARRSPTCCSPSRCSSRSASSLYSRRRGSEAF